MARKVKKKLTPQQRRRRTITIVLSVVGGLIVIAGVIALVVWLKVTGEAPLPEDVREGVEATQQARQRPQARHQIQQVHNALRNNRSERFRIRLTNADVRALLNEAGSIRGVSNPHVYCGEGRVVVTGRAEHGGRNWNLQAAITLQAHNGGLQASLTDLKVGSMNAPAELRNDVQKQLQRNVAKQTPEQTGLYIQNISIHPGYAIISGYTTGK